MVEEYKTSRLILRSWKSSDRKLFAAMNDDAQVMEYMPTRLSYVQSDLLIDKIQEGFQANGFGIWALEEKETGQFIGFTGLSRPSFSADFTPCVEIAWRLDLNFWGKGFATEAALKALEIGFTEYNLLEIVAFTVPENKRSLLLMQRLGMQYCVHEDFNHPLLPFQHPLSLHQLYRLNRSEWMGRF